MHVVLWKEKDNLHFLIWCPTKGRTTHRINMRPLLLELENFLVHFNFNGGVYLNISPNCNIIEKYCTFKKEENVLMPSSMYSYTPIIAS